MTHRSFSLATGPASASKFIAFPAVRATPSFRLPTPLLSRPHCPVPPPRSYGFRSLGCACALASGPPPRTPTQNEFPQAVPLVPSVSTRRGSVANLPVGVTTVTWCGPTVVIAGEREDQDVSPYVFFCIPNALGSPSPLIGEAAQIPARHSLELRPSQMQSTWWFERPESVSPLQGAQMHMVCST